MVVKVRLSAAFSSAAGGEAWWPRIGPALGLLMAPLSLLAFTVSIWAFAAEMQWTDGFVFAHSLFSHWQVWLAIAAVLLLLGRALARSGPS